MHPGAEPPLQSDSPSAGSVGDEKEKKVLSSQEFDGGTAEEGYRYLSSFTFEDTPVWRYEAGGVQVRKEIGDAAHGKYRGGGL